VDGERIFFITTITAQRQPIFRCEATANLLLEMLAHYRDQGKYLLHEFVIMPDHVHLLIMPSPEISLERAVQFIKGGFSFHLKWRGPVWQPGFTNHRVHDLDDYEPVRARMVERAEDYRYSSAGGLLPMDPVPQGLKPCSIEDALTRP